MSPSEHAARPLPRPLNGDVSAMLRIALLIVAASISQAHAFEVTVRDGNVILVNGDQESPLTNTGHDKDASISPDGKWVIFVRQDPTRMRDRTGDPERGPETSIWVVASDGSSTRQLIAEGGDGGPENYGDYAVPQFLSDSRRFIFWSERAAVSGVIAQSDIDGHKIRLICGGNRVEVIRRGIYRDHLIVLMHRYFLGPGTYDWYWLVDLSGTLIGPIGEHEWMVSEFKEMNEEEPNDTTR